MKKNIFIFIWLFILTMNELGLTNNLMPKDSPIAQNQGQVSSYQFDYQNEAVSKIRNAAIGSAQIQNAAIGNAQLGTASIGTANIGTLTFNEISGGTASFGGTLNGNGVVRVLNSSGGTVVSINNQGVQVTDGNISIQDSSGTTILDSSGLVSTANFLADSVTGSTFNTTSTSYTDITSVSLTLVLSRTSRVLILSSARMSSSGMLTGQSAIVGLNIDGTDEVGPAIVEPGYDYGSGLTHQTGAVTTIQSLAAGTHTLKLRIKSTGGGATAYGNQANLTYVVLGK